MQPTATRTDLTPIATLPALYNPRDLALIRRTVAIDTTDDEFALFIHWARSLRLDPLRRQVHALVFNKNEPKKRRLSLVTSIEGFRAIAARTGNYRPDENEPVFISDEALKSETNPASLVSCSVRVWQHSHTQWFPITGVSRWDEFAPLKTVWVTDQIIAMLEKGAGNFCLPWHKPGASAMRPVKVASKAAYRGVNILAL